MRGLPAEALADLGEKLGAYLRVGPLALRSWEAAVTQLFTLAHEHERLVVLNEFPYLLEPTAELDAYIQRAVGVRRPRPQERRPGTRLILCGSAMSVMRQVLAATASLRGRAGLTLRVSPFGLRLARELPGSPDLDTAFLYAIIRLHQARLVRAGADPRRLWAGLRDTFRSQVLGPAFEAAARDWTRHEAGEAILGGAPAHVGASVITLPDGGDVQLGVAVAADDAADSSGRTVLAIGETKLARVWTATPSTASPRPGQRRGRGRSTRNSSHSARRSPPAYAPGPAGDPTSSSSIANGCTRRRMDKRRNSASRMSYRRLRRIARAVADRWRRIPIERGANSARECTPT